MLLKESEKIELKRSTSELKQALIAMSTILNRHEHGEIYFGVRDDGIVVGQDVSKQTLCHISQSFAEHIEPVIDQD